MCNGSGKRLRFNFAVLFVVIYCCLASCMVLADNPAKSVTNVPSGVISTVKGICSVGNNSVNKTILSCNNNGTLSFNSSVYAMLDIDKKDTFMEASLSAVSKSGLGVKVKNKVYNFIANQDTAVSSAIKLLAEDTTADFVTASKWLKPFSGGISTAMGVLCLLIFIFLGFGLCMDLAYLSIPGFQLILERGEENKRPFCVSPEAWKVNRKIASDPNNGENIISAYLKKRVPVILVIAITLCYLISGKIYDVMVFFSESFNKI